MSTAEVLELLVHPPSRCRVVEDTDGHESGLETGLE